MSLTMPLSQYHVQCHRQLQWYLQCQSDSFNHIAILPYSQSAKCRRHSDIYEANDIHKVTYGATVSSSVT